MAVKRKYRLNLRNYGNLPAIMLSQYDEGYALEFEIRDGTDAASDLSAYTVTLKGTRADTLAYSFAGTVSTNVLTFVIDTTMTACAGRGTAEIAIKDTANDVLFATFNMPVFVERAAVPEGSIDADVERAQEIAEQVQEIVDNAAAAVSGEAEKWATGQIDGTDVPSTDPTYENNAKYYAEQAADAAASIGIDATLTQTGKAADAKKTGDEITALKEDLQGLSSTLGGIVPINLITPDVTFTHHKMVNYSTGALSGSSTTPWKTTSFIDLSGIESIAYSRIYTTASSSNSGIAFYDETQTYLSGVKCVANQAEGRYELDVREVPENAVYIRMTLREDGEGYGDGYLYDYAQYSDAISIKVDNLEQGLTDAQTAITADATHVKDVEGDSYYTIPSDKWAIGGWQSYVGDDNRQFRVRCTETLNFDVDTYILTDNGFYVCVLYEDGTSVSADYHAKIKANKNAHIYARRVTEDTSEVISDITPFVSAIKFMTAFSPINIYAPTFTDVSMFERMGIGGDSYSAGGGIISGIRPLTWGKNLERQAGITVDIYAKSGQNVVEWNADTVNGLPALLAGTECGLYWLWHGINGTSTATILGTAADMSASPHPATFYGQYVEAIEQIKATFPNARIVLATITGSNYGLYQTQYKNANIAIKAIAEYCEVPCIDVVDDAFYKSFEYSDNIRNSHPTAMVAAGMAMANRRLIAKCILENPDYFISYGAD